MLPAYRHHFSNAHVASPDALAQCSHSFDDFLVSRPVDHLSSGHEQGTRHSAPSDSDFLAPSHTIENVREMLLCFQDSNCQHAVLPDETTLQFFAALFDGVGTFSPRQWWLRQGCERDAAADGVDAFGADADDVAEFKDEAARRQTALGSAV